MTAITDPAMWSTYDLIPLAMRGDREALRWLEKRAQAGDAEAQQALRDVEQTS